MDETAAISASRVAGNPCVTARISEVEFLTPIQEGDIVRVEAFVYDSGHTSMEVFVRVYGEKLGEDQKNRIATTAEFTFVSVSEDGKPVPADDVSVESEEDSKLVSLAESSH